MLGIALLRMSYSASALARTSFAAAAPSSSHVSVDLPSPHAMPREKGERRGARPSPSRSWTGGPGGSKSTKQLRRSGGTRKRRRAGIAAAGSPAGFTGNDGASLGTGGCSARICHPAIVAIGRRAQKGRRLEAPYRRPVSAGTTTPTHFPPFVVLQKPSLRPSCARPPISKRWSRG